jgi:hypothetical protein
VPQAVTASYYIGEVGYNLREIRELRRVREERFLLTMLGVERSAVPFPDEPPIQFPPTPTWRALTNLRRGKYESSRLVGEVNQDSIRVSKLLDTPVEFRGFDDPDTKLGEALDYLQRAYQIPFEVNQQAFKDEMIDDVLVKPLGKEIPKMRNVSLSTVLRKVLERIPASSGTTWVIRNGTVEVTTGRYAAFEKAIVAYPIADLVIPITTTQQQASVLQPGQLFGLQGFAGVPGGIGALVGIGGLGGIGALAGIGGLGGLGGIGALAGIGGLGGLGAGLGAGIGGIGGIGAGLGAGLGGLGGAAGIPGGIGGGIGALAGIGGLQGIAGGQAGGANLGLGAIGGTQAPLLVRMITQIVGEPDDWAPIDPLQQLGIANKPGGEPDDIDKKPFRNQLAFYPPALALVVKGSSRIQTRPTPPILKNIGEGGLNMGALDKKPGVKVANAGDDRPDHKKPELADADPKVIWQDAMSKGEQDPGVILASVDFLGSIGQWEHASELLKANIRQGVVVRPWVYEALAMTLRQTNASADEIERAEVSAADLEPLDAQGFLGAARAMKELNNPHAALAFCRQAALLQPSVSGPYRDALGYAASAKDTDGLEWAAAQLLSRDWPTENATLHQEAEARVKDLAAALAGGEKSEAAEKMLARLQEARRRDLEITLVWDNGAEPADLDLVVEEPTGSSCTWRAPQTVGGGLRLGGQIGDKKVGYVAAQAFTGTYKVRVERVFGHPLGDKAQLRVVRHKGTPEEREEVISVAVPRGPSDPKKDAVAVKLDGGRRTHVADVPPPETAQRLASAKTAAGSTNDALTQLQRLADPTDGGFGGTPVGMDGPGGLSSGRQPDPGLQDDLAFQTRVSPFVNNNIDVTVQAALSADRRYVRLSMTSTFNVVTGTQLQGPVLRNPIIPGFPTP